MSTDKIQILPLRRLQPPGEKSRRNLAAISNNSESSEDVPQPTKKGRVGKPKVKTGCLTCKIRRVKCDEIKPACERCTSTGRKCDGYVLPPLKKTVRAQSAGYEISRAIDVVPGNQRERRALDYFRSHTAPNLASYFDADFWTRIVMQIGQTEPAIRHAMIAVGALNESRDFHVQGTSIPTKRIMVAQDPLAPQRVSFKERDEHNDPFALGQYNKAISHLARRIRDQSASADIAMLTCILLVCVEFLRRDDSTAMQHFAAGMNIALNVSKASSSGIYNQMHRVREQMLPFFNRLELLSMLFGNDPPYTYPVEIPAAVPANFVTLVEARDSIVHLMNLNLRFIRDVRFRRYEGTLTDLDRSGRVELLSRMDEWKLAFDQLLQTQTLSVKDARAATILDIHRLVSGSWIRMSCSLCETDADANIPDYEAAVASAEMLQEHTGTREQRSAYPSTFLFDMETISPIYLVAIKCRDPGIRRRAIALLRSSCRREGLWDSNVVAAIAEHVMEMEEVGLSTLDGSERPVESMRIHNTLIQSGSGLISNFHQLTFYRRPTPDGPWDVWQESFILEA